MNAPPVVDLIILCGFLGSGKTSLIVDFLKQDQLHDTALIVNEAGAIGIDGVLIEEDASDQSLTVLANGCVCCSLRSSLVDTLTRLLDAPRPASGVPLKRIILETSGLSKPGPIIASLNDPELAQRRLRLLVLSTYDAEQGGLRASEFEEASAQLTAAQRIVFTKLDLVSSTMLEQQIKIACQLNPLAHLFFSTDRQGLVRDAFGALDLDEHSPSWLQRHSTEATSAVPAHPRIHVMRGRFKHALYWDELSEWLDNLAGLCGERLLRSKLLVDVRDCDEPILIQSVGTSFSSPRRMSQQRRLSQVFVIITRDIDSAELNRQMTAYDPAPKVTLEPLQETPSIDKLFSKHLPVSPESSDFS